MRELIAIDAALAVLVDLAANELGSSLGLLLGGQLTNLALQRLLVWHDDSRRIGALVVIEDDLVDQRRLIHNRLLHALGAVLLAVARNQQALESTQYIEETILAHVTHVARVEPAVTHRIGRRFGILPVAGHHVLAVDDDLALLAYRQIVTIGILNLQVDALQHLTRRAEAARLGPRRVGRDDRRSLRQAIALEHRNTDGVEEALQLRVEQCTTTYEEAQLTTKGLAHLREEDLVEQSYGRLQDETPALALREGILVVAVSRLKRQLEELLGRGTLGADRRLDVLAEVLGQSGHREEEVRLHLADVERYVTQRLHRRSTHLRRSYGSTTGNHDVEAGHMGEAVVERQDDERAPTLGNRDAGQGLLHVRGVVAVCQDNTLRVGRRARRIGNRCVVVVLNSLARGDELLLTRLEPLAALLDQGREQDLALLLGFSLRAHDDHVLQKRQTAADRTDLVNLRRRYEDRRNLGVPKAEVEVVGLLQLNRERYTDATCIQEAQLRHNPVVATLRKNRNTLLGFDAHGH